MGNFNVRLCFVLQVGSGGQGVAAGWMSGPTGMYILCEKCKYIKIEIGGIFPFFVCGLVRPSVSHRVCEKR